MSNEYKSGAEYEQPQDGVQHETGDPYTDPMQDAGEGATGGSSATGERATEQELVEELGNLARQVRDLVQAAWRSEQRQQIQEEVKRGINSIAANLEDGFQRASQSEQTQQSVHKARDVAESMGERVRSSQTGQELADGLLRGLRSISRQLNNLADELEPVQKEPGAGDAAASDAQDAQDIPVQRDDS